MLDITNPLKNCPTKRVTCTAQSFHWYNQRANACTDPDLKAILEHNRDEEKEHASMVLEWIRRKDQTFSKELKDYLFTEKPIAHK